MSDITKDVAYIAYLKHRYNINIISKTFQEAQAEIATKICDYYYKGFKSRYGVVDESNYESIRWDNKDTWPNYIVQDRPTKEQFDDLNIELLNTQQQPAHNAATVGLLLYLIYCPEVVNESSNNVATKSISTKPANETPMNWEWMMDEAIKSNQFDPLDVKDNDSEVIISPSTNDINFENIDNSTAIDNNIIGDSDEENIITIGEVPIIEETENS